MRSERVLKDASAIGWISTAEVFLLGALAILAAAVALNAALDQSVRINDGLSDNLMRLKTDLVTLRSEAEIAAAEVRQLLGQNTALAATATALQEENTELIATRDEAIAQAAAAAASLLAESDKLQQKIDELNTAVSKLIAAEADLAKAHAEQKKAEAEHKTLRTQFASAQLLLLDSEDQRVKLANSLAMAQKELADAQALNQTLIHTAAAWREENQKQLAEIKRLADELAATRKGQGKIRQELLGLSGELGSVVFLFDRSGSMKARWAETQQIMAIWLQHLNVEQVAVVAFGDGVEIYPKDGSMMDMRGAAREANRKELSRWLLEEIEPKGFTNTLAAFQRAFEYKEPHGLDMIILFTDGAPRGTNAVAVGRDSDVYFDASMQRDIEALCQQHRVPVNTVGLGKYYQNERLANFLIDLAKANQGSFIGR